MATGGGTRAVVTALTGRTARSGPDRRKRCQTALDGSRHLRWSWRSEFGSKG
jgi:uncharacterized membrane-anchored protein